MEKWAKARQFTIETQKQYCYENVLKPEKINLLLKCQILFYKDGACPCKNAGKIDIFL